MFEIAKEFVITYGMTGAALLGVIGLVWLFLKLEKRVLTGEESRKETAKMCKVRKKYFSDIFDSIEIIEKKDIEDTGKFTNIDIKLINLDEKMDTIGSDVKTIINHFATEGMKK